MVLGLFKMRYNMMCFCFFIELFVQDLCYIDSSGCKYPPSWVVRSLD